MTLTRLWLVSGLCVLVVAGPGCSDDELVCPSSDPRCRAQIQADPDVGVSEEGDTGFSTSDSGTSDVGGVDTTTSDSGGLVDTSTTLDTGFTGQDTGTPPNDTGTPPVDMGVDTGPITGFVLDAQPVVGLPYVLEGANVPTAGLEVYALGDEGSMGNLSVVVDGPFSVTGVMGPLGVGETRQLTVSFTGSSAAANIANGEAHFEADGQVVDVALSAVVGHVDIPEVVWTNDRYGAHAIFELPRSAPFNEANAPRNDPSVLVVVPPGLTDVPNVGIVTHIHGFNAVIDATVARQKLAELHTLSGRNAVLIAPQGLVSTRDGDFGRLDNENGHRNLVEDVLRVLYRDGFIQRPLVGEVVITSHSGGYKATANMINVGGLDVTAAHLYDSLYGRIDDYEAFVLGGGVLRSNYTGGSTATNNTALRDRLRNAGRTVGEVLDDGALYALDVTLHPTPWPHNDCMFQERLATRWLTHSGLAPRPDAPVELLATVASGGQVTVTWRGDRGAPEATYRVQGSADGSIWSTLEDTNQTTATVAPTAYLRVVRVTPGYGESAPSDTYGATGDDWLVVDGFDRVLGGSYLDVTHPFAAPVGQALGVPYSMASNEAVMEGLVDLMDYTHVIWLLGDESTSDITFEALEKTAIKDFLGRTDAVTPSLIVSGSEVGYATDGAWLTAILDVSWPNVDNARSSAAGGYTFGVTYPEDYPDALVGDTTIWTYDGTAHAAAVASDDAHIIVVGFPLETLANGDRATAIQELVNWY